MNRRDFARAGTALAVSDALTGRAQQTSGNADVDLHGADPSESHYSWWQRQPVDVQDWPALIGPESQLFVDDYLVAARANVSRQFRQPVKHPGYVLQPKRPWEGTACIGHGTVVEAPPGKLRMSYEGWTGDIPFDKASENPRCALLPCVVGRRSALGEAAFGSSTL